MARSKSKNKTLAVGEKVHAEVTRLQHEHRFKNHDEVVSWLLHCLNEHVEK
jgi:hypothetical protein